MADRRPLAGLLAGYAVTTLGTRMTAVALPWFVLVSTGSVARAGLTAFAEMTPYVLVGALGGPYVDRFGPVRAAVAGNLLAAAAVGTVPILYAAGLLHFPVLLAAVAVAGFANGVAGAGLRVLVPATGTLAGTSLERVAGLVDGLGRLALLLGAPVAGLLLVVAGAPVVLAADAASFAICAVLVAATVPASVQPPQRSESTYLTQLRVGFRWLLGHRLMLGIGVLTLVMNLIDQAWSAVLLPAWVRQEIGRPAALGAVFAALALGLTAGNVLYTWLGPRLPRRRTFTWALLIGGSPHLFVLALSHSVSIVLAVTAAGGLASGALNPIFGAVEYEQVPPELRARVLSAANAISWGGIPLGGLLGGWLAGTAGVTATLLGGAVVYLLVTLTPFFFPAWAGLERQPAAAAHSHGSADRS
jgi:MFS family permease